jgi:hypothetical protein
MGLLSSLETEKDRWAVRLGLGSLVLWFVSWGLIWQGRVNTAWADNIFEPAVVAIQLGGVAIAVFVALHLREGDDRMRSAIAGAVIVPYLLLVIDLLTLPDFRESLAGSAGGGATTLDPTARLDFVQQMFDTFKWSVTAVVGFYFTAEAANGVADKVQTGKTNRSTAEAMKAQAMAQAAAGQPVPPEAMIPGIAVDE